MALTFNLSGKPDGTTEKKTADFSAVVPFGNPLPLRTRPVTGGGLLGAIQRFPGAPPMRCSALCNILTHPLGKDHLATRPDTSQHRKKSP